MKQWKVFKLPASSTAIMMVVFTFVYYYIIISFTSEYILLFGDAYTIYSSIAHEQLCAHCTAAHTHTPHTHTSMWIYKYIRNERNANFFLFFSLWVSNKIHVNRNSLTWIRLILNNSTAKKLKIYYIGEICSSFFLFCYNIAATQHSAWQRREIWLKIEIKMSIAPYANVWSLA